MKHVESKTRGQRLEPPLSLWIISFFQCHCNVTGGRVMSHGVVLNSARARKGKNLRTPPVLTCQRRSVTPWQPPASPSARLSCGWGTNPLPATSHALGIRSGRHPRSRGGQVPNPEPRGAKPPHQVHHGGTAAESPNMGRFCHFFKTFFSCCRPPRWRSGMGQAREMMQFPSQVVAGEPSPDQRQTKAAPRHLHPPPVPPESKQQRDPIKCGMGGSSQRQGC